MEKGIVIDKTKGKEITFPPLPPVMNKILREGVLLLTSKSTRAWRYRIYSGDTQK